MNPDSAARLCAACGMCCDGTLFHAVKLQAGDSRRALAALGLKVRRKGGENFFAQPCPAHRMSCCTIYEARPARCRDFSCRQLMRLNAGEIGENEALARVREARAGVERVQKLMGRLAETNPRRALVQRVANALTDAPSEMGSLRDELETAMGELEALLARACRVN
jgi:uncharacterized protein